MTNNYIVDTPHTWRTEIPNIVDEMGLDPYAFRIYAHLKRVAGDGGACWQSTRTMADICKMGVGSVSRAKQTLKEHGLILIEERTNIDNQTYHHVTIVNIWLKNYEHFTAQQQGCSPDERPCSPDERKKNPSKKFTPSAVAEQPNASSPANFEDWLAELKQSKNKQAVIARMIYTLFPAKFPQGIPKTYYGRVAKTVKHRRIQTYERLAQLTWQANGYRPTGDVLAYVIGLAQNGGREPPQQSGGHPGDKIVSRDGKTVVRLGQ